MVRPALPDRLHVLIIRLHRLLLLVHHRVGRGQEVVRSRGRIIGRDGRLRPSVHGEPVRARDPRAGHGDGVSELGKVHEQGRHEDRKGEGVRAYICGNIQFLHGAHFLEGHGKKSLFLFLFEKESFMN